MPALLLLAMVRPFVGVLLWSWISFMNPHRQLYGIGVEQPWAAVVFCATIVGCVLGGEPRRFVLNWVTALMLALMASLTLTSLFALAPPAEVWAKWSRVEKALLALLLTAALLTERRRLHALVWIMVISIGYYSVRGGIFTILTGGQYRVYGPELTMIEDNNHLAVAMLVTLPLMNYLRMQSQHAFVRLSLAAVMTLTLLAVVASYSRGALLGLLAATGVMWLRTRRKVASGLVLAVCVAAAIAFMPDGWGQRMETIGTYQEDSSASDRLTMWSSALKLALDRPMIGSGFMGPYTREVMDRVAPLAPARAVHSIWFEFLGEHGFPSFCVWLGLTIAGAAYTIRLTRLARNRPELAWAYDFGRMAQVSIVAYLVGGTFLSLSYWDFYWTLLVAIAGAHTLAVGELQHKRAPFNTAAAMQWRQGGALAKSSATAAGTLK
jgi:probable O-glycosylation ligase (exosortase A-associated)